MAGDMNQQEKKFYPLLAALLASKVLKQLMGDSRDPMPCFLIRGHETMSVTLHISAMTKGEFWIECEGDEIARYEDEIGALIGLTHYTFESTKDYAAGWLAGQHELLREAIRGDAPKPQQEPPRRHYFSRPDSNATRPSDY